MADSGSDDENVKLIELKFKTIQENLSLQVKENSTIGKLKELLSQKINQPIEKICLIFSGKILKDHENISQHNISAGMVIHMVIRNQPSASLSHGRETSTSSVSPPASSANTNTGAAPFGTELFNNPELIRGIMNSPFVESIMANPEFMRTMFTENPQFQQIIQNNPELGHIMNDPSTMRQMMEMMRNPTMLNELMRNHDQAVRNLQGIPGGEAALQRIYEQVQEPLLNSMLRQPENAANATSQTGGAATPASRSQHAGVENAQPLPNPWSNIVNQTQGTPAGGHGAQGSPNLPFGNLLSSPGMQSLFRQISTSPNLMQQLLSQDNMRNFSQMVGNNPALFNQMMQSLPGFDNPEMANQIRNNMPQITSLMTNPQMLQAMTNPAVINALQQIQQATQVLRQEIPQLFANFPGADMFQNLGGMAGLFGGLANAASQQPSQPPTSADENAPQPQQNIPTGEATTGLPNVPQGFAELLGSLMNLSTSNHSQPPEERFRAQLEQLASMGFTDQQANIQALLASFGDVSGAIERLLNRNDRGNAGAQ